jgi:hypothetical protein
MDNYKYPWKYSRQDRPPGRYGRCYDCGAPYNSFHDMMIPDDMWELISPSTIEGGGLLCPTCMVNRLEYLNLWYDILSPLERLNNG